MSTIDFATELSRKTLDAVGSVLSQVNDGQLSPAEARVALRAVFDSVSGLVSTDCFHLLTQADAELGALGPDALHSEVVRVFINDKGCVARLKRRWGDPVVTLDVLNPGDTSGAWSRTNERRFDDAMNPFSEAWKWYCQAAESLTRNGYKELP